MQERGLEDKAVKMAQSRGWLVRKVKWIGRRGGPDRVFLKNSLTIWVEFKQLDKDLRVQQNREVTRMREHGAYVVRIDRLSLADEIFQ